MTCKDTLFVICVVFGAAAADASEYLASVTSEVYRATGTPKQIATRANTCISQLLSSRSADDPLIISSNLEDGVIVARNSIEYGSVMRWKIRSRFTLEARDGRFRVEQTNLERYNTNMLTGEDGWGPIGKWPGSKWQEVQSKFEASAKAVADCVINGANRDDW